MPNDERARNENDTAFGEDDRVVPLRPRPSAAERGGRAARGASDEEAGDADDNGHRRTLANLVGLLLVVGLIATGIWLAHAIANMRRSEDCVFSGRRNCMTIEIPSPVR
jgi:hypothetical protein